MRQEEYESLGEITDKGLTIYELERFRAAMQRFPKCGVVVTVKVHRDTRSSAQNRFWHGAVIPAFAEHCGYEFHEMKDALALELLPVEVVDVKTGECKTIPGHTSRLNTKEFKELIERAQRLGAEMGVYVPDPGEFSDQLADKPKRQERTA